jgi:hypothetical protein
MSEIYYAIVEGDPLDNANDSRVLQGADHSTIADNSGRPRRQTHLGHQAWCGVCKTTGPIHAGAGIRESLRGWDGRLQALQAVSGDIVLCKCDPPPRVVSVHARRRKYIDSGRALAAVLQSTPTSDQRSSHDEQFAVKDRNGHPLVNVRYRARIGSNVVASGVTDAQGRTQRMNAESAKRITLKIADI